MAALLHDKIDSVVIEKLARLYMTESVKDNTLSSAHKANEFWKKEREVLMNRFGAEVYMQVRTFLRNRLQQNGE